MKRTNRLQFLIFVFISFSFGCETSNSESITNSVTTLDRCISRNNFYIDQLNDNYHRKFQFNLDMVSNTEERLEKVKFAVEQAEKARILCTETIMNLYTYKEKIITENGGLNTETQELKNSSMTIAPRQIMIEQGYGKQMKQELFELKKNLAILIDNVPKEMKLSNISKSFAKVLPIDLDSTKSIKLYTSWEDQTFNNTPAIAAVAIIDKYINEIKWSELLVLQELEAMAWGDPYSRGLPIIN